MKTKSTTGAIVSLINKIAKDLDNEIHGIGNIFYLSKAFDMVDDELL